MTITVNEPPSIEITSPAPTGVKTYGADEPLTFDLDVANFAPTSDENDRHVRYSINGLDQGLLTNWDTPQIELNQGINEIQFDLVEADGSLSAQAEITISVSYTQSPSPRDVP